MLERLERNIPSITEEEQEKLLRSSVLVAGCGGLGGWILEELLRLGIGNIRVADGDVFEPSNGNRQLLCTNRTLGRRKTDAAAERAEETAPETRLETFPEFLTKDNVLDIVSGTDLVLDALDNPEDRLLLESACRTLNIPLIHGAVSGWCGQVAVCLPGSGTLRKVYGCLPDSGQKKDRASCLVSTAAVCASLQAAEAVKLLCKRGSGLTDRLLVFDLLHQDFSIIEL